MWSTSADFTTMAPVQLECTVAECDIGDGARYRTPLLDEAVAVQILAFHRQDIHGIRGDGPTSPTPPTQRVKAKMDPPKVQLGVDQQTWDQFMARWVIFKAAMGVDVTHSSMYFFSCLDKDLGDEVLKANPGGGCN